MIAWRQLCIFIYTYWWKPRTISKIMGRQGIRGPPPRFIAGNLSDMTQFRDLARLLKTSTVSVTTMWTDSCPNMCSAQMIMQRGQGEVLTVCNGSIPNSKCVSHRNT